MSENTYLEQYLNQVILPRYLHDWLMKSLKEMKGKKNAGQLNKVHKLIDLVEKSGKKLALYEKVFLELMVTDYKYIWNKRWNRSVMERKAIYRCYEEAYASGCLDGMDLAKSDRGGL